MAVALVLVFVVVGLVVLGFVISRLSAKTVDWLVSLITR